MTLLICTAWLSALAMKVLEFRVRNRRFNLLHAIRIALIIDSLTLICHTPNFGDNIHHSNDHIISLGLRLDFPSVISIIKSAFTADNAI